jgi:hypothetical protein
MASLNALSELPSCRNSKINIGVRKKPAPPESAGGYQREIWGGPESEVAAPSDDFVPQPLHHRIDQRRAPRQRRAPVAGHREFLLDGSGLPRVQVA